MDNIGKLPVIWPVFFMLFGIPPFILVAGIVFVCWAAGKAIRRRSMHTADKIPDIPVPVPQKDRTEQEIVLEAFLLLKERIDKYLRAIYPEACWNMLSPNALMRFSEGREIVIALRNTHGYTRARVLHSNLQFQNLLFVCHESPAAASQAEPETEAAETPVDFSLMAFEWTSARVDFLNSLANKAISQSENVFHIDAGELPDPDCWQEICDVLKDEFHEAGIEEDQIKVTISG